MLRRTFLKTASAVIGGVLVSKYLEPMFNLADVHKDWIEDKGDFYIVRVPDNSIFKNEKLDKPVIFVTGAYVTLANLDVQGYANIIAKGPINIRDNVFDASKVLSLKEMDRSVVRFDSPVGDASIVMRDCNIIGNQIARPRSVDVWREGAEHVIHQLPFTEKNSWYQQKKISSELIQDGILSRPWPLQSVLQNV
jgi:hypothetical protein